MLENEQLVLDYATRTVDNPLACMDTRAAARRFLNDLDSGRWDWRPEEAEFIIMCMETLFCHQKGESIEGRPLRGTPFLLQDWNLSIWLAQDLLSEVSLQSEPFLTDGWN